METLFHIGMGKTGSTTLQGALRSSMEYLLTRGVLYPSDPNYPKMADHRLFATQVAPLMSLTRSMASLGSQEEALARFAKFHSHIRQEVAIHQPGLLLFSAEHMFTAIRPRFRVRLADAFDTIGPSPRFVAYLRRPSHLYASSLQQILQASAQLKQPFPPNYSKVVAAYADLFGGDRVKTHLFERSALHRGDVVADFTHRHLAPHGVDFNKLTKVGELNIGLSAEATKIVQAFRRTFHDGRDDRYSKDTNALLSALRSADAAVGAERPRLQPGIAEIVDYGSTDPLVLRDRYGVVFSDFDYRRLEAGTLAALPNGPFALDQVLVIDGTTEAAIIRHLMTSEWAGTPKHARWLARLRREAI